MLNRLPIRARRLLPFWLLGVLAGGVATWKVFEFDLFFHMRAGAEILSGGPVLRVDTWTHTIRDRIWYNFEWLSGVVFHLAYRLGGYPALVILRSALIGATTSFAFWVALRAGLRVAAAGFARPRVVLLGSLLAFFPLYHSILSFRYQLRPEIWSYFFFAALLVSWTGSRKSARFKVFAGTLIIWAWAQFHGGSAAIGVALHSMGIVASRRGLSVRQKRVWAGIALAAWLATPLGFHQIRVLWENAFANHYSVTENPDLAPFRWGFLRVRNGGDSLKVWLAFSVVSLLGLVILPRDVFRRLPSFYRHRWLALGAGATLTAYVFHLMRVIPFQVIFLLPVFFAFFAHGLSKRPKPTLAATALLALWAWVGHFPDLLRYVNWERGFGPSLGSNPFRVAEFLRTHPIEGNLYNVPAYGGYLEWAVPGTPVFMDGRGLNYLSILGPYHGALDDPLQWPSFLKTWNLTAAVEFGFEPRLGKEARAGFLLGRYPASEWAVVAFDNASILLMKRTPAHRRWIEENEYRFLDREQPPEVIAFAPGVSTEVRDGAELEVTRCLAFDPDNAFCLRTRAAFRRKKGQSGSALVDLERAFDLDSRNVALMIQLQDFYEKLGKHDSAAAIGRRLQRQLGPVSVFEPGSY